MTSLDRLGSIGKWKGSKPSDQLVSVSREARMMKVHPIYRFTNVDLRSQLGDVAQPAIVTARLDMDLSIAPLGFHPFGDEQRIDISQGGGNGQVNQQVVVKAVTITPF